LAAGLQAQVICMHGDVRPMQIYTEGELVRLVKAPIWVILIAALGLVAGLATYGYNVGTGRLAAC
jgi:phosphate/sulfate permease